MAEVDLAFYKDEAGRIPLLEWFKTLKPKGLAKCRAKIERLSRFGHKLHQPEADYLRDGIYELRVGLEGLNYRMLYFFYENTAVLISSAIVKDTIAALKEIDVDIDRKGKFEENPQRHTYEEIRGGGKPTSDGVEILHRLCFEKKPEMIALLEEERANAEIAQKIYMLRKEAGLPQRALAKLAGTTSFAMCRLENADYNGHSLAMLRRIAAALNKSVEFKFVDLPDASKRKRA